MQNCKSGVGIIRTRLIDEVVKKGGLADNQFDFRTNRFTIHAIEVVKDTVLAGRNGMRGQP